jgi:hypothetical protein
VDRFAIAVGEFAPVGGERFGGRHRIRPTNKWKKTG